MSEDEQLISAWGEKTTLNPSCNYKHLPYSKYSKKYICMTQKRFINHYGTWTFKENNNLISCSTNCSASPSFIRLSTRMFSANMQKVTMENGFFMCSCNIKNQKSNKKKSVWIYIQGKIWNDVSNTQENSGLIWEHLLPQGKVLTEWKQDFPILILEIL